MRSLFERPAHDARFTGGATRQPTILLFAMVLPIVLLLCMLALTPLGQWQTDELLTMRFFRDQGIDALWQRVMTWSPRPLSETLLYSYSVAVHATGHQLIGVFLLGLWSLLIAACILPAALIRTGDDGGRGIALLMSLTILALLISGHPVSEAFYWSQGAVAYIPTIAFIAAPLLCLVLVQQRTVWLDATMAVCVALAALSSEVGAFFAVAWGCAAPCLLWFGRWRIGAKRVIQSTDVLFLLPLLAGLGVVYLLATARFGNEGEIFDATIARNFVASVRATISTFPSDVLAVDLFRPTRPGVAFGIISKTALFGFCLIAFARVAGRASLDLRLLVAAFGLAALASALFSLFAAYYQFGMNCCQRHQTIRSQLVVVAVVTFAFAVAQIPNAARLRRWNAAWLAGLSVVAVASSAAFMPAALDSDFAHYRRTLQARLANWNDGMSSSPTMTLRLSHQGAVTGAIAVPAGVFENNDSTPRPFRAMMDYFNKTKIIAE